MEEEACARMDEEGRMTTDELYDVVEAYGISRRDFVKYLGSLAALIGLSDFYIPQIAEAVAAKAKLTPVLWVSQGLCTGCTESLAQNTWPTVDTILLDLLSVNYQETLTWAMGKQTLDAARETITKYKGKYITVVEGSIEEAEGGNVLRIDGKPGTDELKEMCKDAAAVVAVGSCAVDGGWVAARPNVAKATGTQAYLEKVGIKTPVVNIPTCPFNPLVLSGVLVNYLLLGKLPALDDHGRPVLDFGQTIHDNCERRGHFDRGEFVAEFGSPEEADGWCLYKMGCKGPTTPTSCPSTRWNGATSWCVKAGSPCIGCGQAFPNWVDSSSPFYQRLADVSLPGWGVSPYVIGEVVGVAAVVGLGAHFIGQVATGRLGKGGPEEKPGKERGER